MGVIPITPAALLVPALVKITQSELGPKQCRKRGIGKLRRDFAAMGPLPTITAALVVLESCCRVCGACKMGQE